MTSPEVVADLAVVACEACHESTAVVLAAQRQRRELEPRRPALGRSLKQLDVGCVEPESRASR